MPIDLTRLDISPHKLNNYMFTPKINGTRAFLLGMKGRFYLVFPETERVRSNVFTDYASKIMDQELLLLDGEYVIQPIGNPRESVMPSFRMRSSVSENERFVQDLELFVPCDTIAIAGHSCVGMPLEKRIQLLRRIVDALNGVVPANLYRHYKHHLGSSGQRQETRRTSECEAHQAQFLLETLQVYAEALDRNPSRDVQSRISLIVNKPFTDAKDTPRVFEEQEHGSELDSTSPPLSEGWVDSLVPLEEASDMELGRIPYAAERKEARERIRKLKNHRKRQAGLQKTSLVRYTPNLYMHSLNRSMSTDGVIVLSRLATYRMLHEGRNLLKYKWKGSHSIDVKLLPPEGGMSGAHSSLGPISRLGAPSSSLSVPHLQLCKFACRFPKPRYCKVILDDTPEPVEPLTLVAKAGVVSQLPEGLMEAIKSRLLSHLPSALHDWVWNKTQGTIQWDMCRASICLLMVRFDKEAGRWIPSEDARVAPTTTCTDAPNLFTMLMTSSLYPGKPRSGIPKRVEDKYRDPPHRYTLDVPVQILSLDLKNGEAVMGYRFANNSSSWQEDYSWNVQFQYQSLQQYLEEHRLSHEEDQSADLQAYIEQHQRVVRSISRRKNEGGGGNVHDSNCRVMGTIKYPSLSVMQHQQIGETIIGEVYLSTTEKHVKNLRLDKDQPNFILTVWSVMQSVLCNITTEEFFRMLLQE